MKNKKLMKKVLKHKIKQNNLNCSNLKKAQLLLRRRKQNKIKIINSKKFRKKTQLKIKK